ncbi:MAG TPA: hypothetical protein VGE14_08410 [Marmoricola sp.]
MEPLGNGFGDLLARGALALVALCVLWLLAVVVAIVLEARGRGAWTRRTGCPPALRAWLLAVLVSASAGAVAPAHAADPGPRRPDTATGVVHLDGLDVPDRQAGVEAARRVLDVHEGDCLWTLARGLLAADASDADVAEAAVALHRHNRAVIGPDPDLLRTGQRLRVPSLSRDFSASHSPQEAP